jgi:hypothetical protein
MLHLCWSLVVLETTLPRFENLAKTTLKNVNNSLNTNVYSYLETWGGQNSYLYLNLDNFFNTSVN